MNTRLKRMAAATIGLSLLAVTMAVPAFAAPPGGSSRTVSVTGVPSFVVSAGESVPITITIANQGKQNLNSVALLFGFDDDPDFYASGDATFPTSFPDGFSVTTSSAGCSGGATLSCSLGSLRSRASVSVSAVISTTTATSAGGLLTEAVVSVAEGGGDNGYNIDTFSDQGTIDIVAFSCDSTTAYRPGNTSKDVATCALGDTRNGNNQSAAVRIPSRLTTVALSEVAGGSCPLVNGYSCYGEWVEANVTGDTTSDVVTWTLQYKLNGLNINVNKLQVYHENDEQQLTPDQDGVLIELGKKNACKSASSVNCGSAAVSNDVLTIVFQTAGNGSSRTLRG